MSVRIKIGKWCVYAHYVGGRCIYAGMGRPPRPFTDTKRSPEWHDAVKDGYEVEIISWHSSMAECLDAERRVIREMGPQCNKMHNGWVPEAFRENWKIGARSPQSAETKARIGAAQRRAWQRGRPSTKGKPVISDTGEVFDSITDAAASIGVSVSAMSVAISKSRLIAGRAFTRWAP